ncbi:hypothetical protein D3C78_1722280 [compost metagenome]
MAAPRTTFRCNQVVVAAPFVDVRRLRLLQRRTVKQLYRLANQGPPSGIIFLNDDAARFVPLRYPVIP